MMPYRSVYILFLLGVLSLFSATASADTARAQKIIEDNSERLIDALQADTLTRSQQETVLALRAGLLGLAEHATESVGGSALQTNNIGLSTG